MQVSGLSEELTSEKCRTTELQQALEHSQESHSKLHSDFYGKESEVSALQQDLKVRRKEWTSSPSLWAVLKESSVKSAD